jgi:NADPH:quinone reductase-like Zn-dependent oxidoreductase
MQAIVRTRYGSPDVLEIRQVPKPEPKSNEILIRVYATTVSRTDCGMLRAHPFFMRLASGLFRPKLTILGMDFAGVVAAVGSGGTSFDVGDRVFGLSPDTFGAHAEYLCLPADGQIAKMPWDKDFDEVVLCEGAWYAQTCLEQLGLTAGQNILIYGASGAIGTAAVQLAKFYGAEVTAVVATRHLQLAQSLGADHVIDYTAQDFTQLDGAFDSMLDAVGKTRFLKCRRLLKPGAKFAATDLGPWWQNLAFAAWSSVTGNGRFSIPFPRKSKGFVGFLKARLEASQLRAVVDRSYPLDEVPGAFRYVETAQKTGIVVINVASTGCRARQSPHLIPEPDLADTHD